jgi:hypothetical protein
MSGGKGGSQTTKVEVPQYIEDAAKANLARADEIAQIGYTPYYGPDVAAFTPMQQASFQNTADTANAFGMGAPASKRDIYGGMGAPTTYAGGVQGYSSAPIYEQSVSELRRQRPGQYKALMAPFINPVTGADPAAPFGGRGGKAGGGGGGGGGRGKGRDGGGQGASGTLTDRERRAGLTEQMKARGMSIADVMGR